MGQMNTQQRIVALILVVVISLSLTQNLAFGEDQQSQGSITIIATGTATPIGNSENSTSAADSMLNLSGSISSAAENKMGFDGLTGILHIGQIGYLISDGQGQSYANGTIEIQAKTNGTVGIGDENGNGNSGDQMDLVLKGSMQGNNVTFDSNESKLASLDLLSLSGQVDVYLFSTSAANSSQSASESPGNEISNVETSNNEVSSATTNVAQTAIQANTTLTITEVNNYTVTETIGNQTVTQTILQPNATTTVTVTQVQNLTITQTETVTSGNITSIITQTTTLMNVTITATATVTVANQTITTTTT